MVRRVVLALAVVGAGCGDNGARLDGPSGMDADAPDARLAVDAPADAAADAAIDARAPLDAAIDAPAPPDAAIDAPAVDAPPASDGGIDAPAFDAGVDAPELPPLTFEHDDYDVGFVAFGASLPGIRVRNNSPFTITGIEAESSDPVFADIGCPNLLAGHTCTLNVDFEPLSLGPASGVITVTADDFISTSATVHGTVDAFIPVTVDGSGSVTADPAATDCPDCYRDGTVITFTAHPDPGNAVTGWSEPTCGTASTCTVTASADVHVLLVSFAPATIALEVDFSGAASGEVDITQPVTGFGARCQASCSVAVNASDDVVLTARTPADFGGFTGCPAASGGSCTIPAISAPAAVGVAFTGPRNERDLTFDSPVLSVAFDAAGDLVVGTTTRVVELSPAFVERWSFPTGGTARVDASGDVFVRTETSLVKLDATGHTLWTTANGEPFPSIVRIGHSIVPLPGGGVAVDTGTSVVILDTNGAFVRAFPFAVDTPDLHALAADSAGIVYAAVLDADAETTDILALSPDGTTTVADVIAGHDGAALAVDTSDVVAGTSTGHGRVDLAFAAVTLEHTTASAQTVCAALAAGPDGDVAWAYSHSDADPGGLDLFELDAGGTVAWSLVRPPDSDRNALQLFDVASSPARVAVGGRFFSTGVVELFDR